MPGYCLSRKHAHGISCRLKSSYPGKGLKSERAWMACVQQKYSTIASFGMRGFHEGPRSPLSAGLRPDGRPDGDICQANEVFHSVWFSRNRPKTECPQWVGSRRSANDPLRTLPRPFFGWQANIGGVREGSVGAS